MDVHVDHNGDATLQDYEDEDGFLTDDFLDDASDGNFTDDILWYLPMWTIYENEEMQDFKKMDSQHEKENLVKMRQ